MMTNEQAKSFLEGLRSMQENPSEGPPFPCPRCGLYRMNTVALRNAKSRQINVFICDTCGKDETLSNAAKLSPIPLKKWAMVKTYDRSMKDIACGVWILADEDSMQHVKKLSDTRYHLIQMTSSVPGKDRRGVYSDIITVTDYLNPDGSADKQLTSILVSFGYDGAEHVRTEYRDAANRIMCECIFEDQWPGPDANVRFTGTRAECEIFIAEFITR